jgi:hypothetical protein
MTPSDIVRGCEPRLIAEWQQRGPETFLGHAVTKLRLTLAPMQSATR